MWLWLGRVLLGTERGEHDRKREKGMGRGRPGSESKAWDVVPEAHSQAPQLVLGTRWKGSFQGPTADLLNRTCQAGMGSSHCLHQP